MASAQSEPRPSPLAAHPPRPFSPPRQVAPTGKTYDAWSKFFEKHAVPLRAPVKEAEGIDDTDCVRRGGHGAGPHGIGEQQRPQTSSPNDAVGGGGLAGAADPNSPITDRTPLVQAAQGIKGEGGHEEAMRKLRRLVLTDGVPPDDVLVTQANQPLRPLVWKLLLSIRELRAAPYLVLISKGPSPAHDKIRNDTFRTLATDQGFKSRVHEDKLVRLLDAFVWKYHDVEEGLDGTQPLAKSSSAASSLHALRNASAAHSPQPEPPAASGTYSFSYVQGMNVLAAPFLYVLPSELEAFHCFSRFIERCCPLYVQPTLEGVHRGLKLVDRCLEMADAELYAHLEAKKLSAELYAFPSVMTFCACTPPLDQVLQLWDFLLAFGAHLNILCVVAQLLLIRDELLQSPSPMRLLRTLPPLDAQRVVGIAVTLVRDLPDDIYEQLVLHAGVTLHRNPH